MPSDLDRYLAAPLERVHLEAELTYRRFGSGPAILLIHGWPLSGATYRALVRRLSARYTCYVPDLPGAGATPWAAGTRDIFGDWAALLVRFLDALGIERVALIGQDSGGAIARLVAAQLGARVALLGLMNTELSNHVPPMVKLYMALARVPLVPRLFGALLSSARFRRSALGFGLSFANRDLIGGEFHEACVAALLRDPGPAFRMLRHADPHLPSKLPAIHRRITAPTVLLWGDRDPYFPIERARAMQRELPDVRAFYALEGHGLMVQEEAPDQLADKLEPWLDQLHRASVAATTQPA